MKRYRTIKPIYLYGGLICLEDCQARPRLETGRIKKSGADGVYDIVGEVCFISGEVIGLEVTDLATLGNLVVIETDDQPEKVAEQEQTAQAVKPSRRQQK